VALIYETIAILSSNLVIEHTLRQCIVTVTVTRSTDILLTVCVWHQHLQLNNRTLGR